MKNNIFNNTARNNGFLLFEIIIIIATLVILVSIVSLAIGHIQ